MLHAFSLAYIGQYQEQGYKNVNLW